MAEAGWQLEIPIKVSGTATQIGSTPFSTSFSAEEINALRLGKVKMPTLELYDRTTDLEEPLVCIKLKCTSKM